MAGTRNQRRGTPGMRFPKTAVPVIGRGLRPLLILLFSLFALLAAAVHHSLSQVHEMLGNAERAAYHRTAHERHRTDDLAVATAVARHRAVNPPANHAAEAITLYDLQREVGVLTGVGSSGRHPEHGTEGADVDAAVASCTEQDIDCQEAGRP